MTLREIIAAALFGLGTLFALAAAVGVLRMPDLYTRMSATSKASTLGVGLIMAGAAVALGALGAATRAVAIVLFLLLTTPVAAHMIGRAAYLSGVPLWKATVDDELRGQYNPVTHQLGSQPDTEAVRVRRGGADPHVAHSLPEGRR